MGFVDAVNLHAGQFGDVRRVHRRFPVEIHKARRIEPDDRCVVFCSLFANGLALGIRQAECVEHQIELIIRHILICEIVMEIIIHRRTDTAQIRRAIKIEHGTVDALGDQMDALLVINNSNLVGLGLAVFGGLKCDALLHGHHFVDILVLVAAAVLMLVKPPRKGIFAEITGKIALERVERVLNGEEIVGIAVEIAVQMRAAVLLGQEQHLAQCKRILHLALRDISARPAIVINAGRGQKVHHTGIENLARSCRRAGAVIIRAAERSVERADERVGIALLQKAGKVNHGIIVLLTA